MSLLDVDDLRVRFDTEEGVVEAVDGVSFSIAPGETLGIVGESGCGKSVTAMTVLGLTRAPETRISGRIELDGQNLLELPNSDLQGVRGDRVSMIFQDPLSSLHPFFRVGDQLVEAIRVHQDLSPDKARRRAVELLGLVGIPEPDRRNGDYPHELSGGMRQRVMIAMALANEPALLIADEPTTALDVTTQAQILKLLQRLQAELGMAMIMITHDLGVIAEVAERVLVMYAGRIVEEGTLDQIFHEPQHPYTWGLLGSVTRLDRPRSQRLSQIEGQPPSLIAPPQGCHFRPRCPHSFGKCIEKPRLEKRGSHLDRCWLDLERKRSLRVLKSGDFGLREPTA